MCNAQKQRLFNSRYIILLSINLIVSISFSMVYTTISKYVTELGVSVTIAGIVTGAFNLSSMVIRPFSGLITDRFNRKRLLIFSTIGMGAAICGYALVSDPTLLIIFRVLHGISFALSTTVNMAIIPGIVPYGQIGEAICYYGLSQSLAMAVGPAFGLWIAEISSLAITFVVSSILCVLGGILAVPFSFSDEIIPKKHKGLKFSDIIVPCCLPFTMIEITIAAVAGIENSMMVLYASSQGIENISWYFSLSAVTVCFCRLFLGKILDKRGTFAVFPGLGLMIVGLIILWQQQAPWMFGLAAILKTIGANLAKPALQAASVKSVSPDRRGAAVSTYYIGTDLGQGVSPMIGGRIVDMNGGNYGILFMLFSIPLAVAGIIYYGISARWKGKEQSKLSTKERS